MPSSLNPRRYLYFIFVFLFLLKSRDYGGGFLYGQPELFGSLGDGLLAARSEALSVVAAASSGGGGSGGDSLKPLRNHHDGSGFLHGHVPSSVSVTATIQSAQNGRQHQVNKWH